jgi:transposase InsO family protein
LIAGELAMAHATVSRCLKRRGLSRWPRPAREEVRRFEWPCPGDLLQMDVKRFARFATPGHKVTGDRSRSGAEKRARVGWEYCHSILDDHSRLVYSELHRDERANTVTEFVERAPGFFADHGIRPRRPQTDNAFAYIHNRGLRALLARHAIEHRRIPPRTPKRNGKVERYQQTLARESAYGQRYRSSDARAAALPHWLNHYNTTRPHSAIGNRPPISRAPFGSTRGRTSRRGGDDDASGAHRPWAGAAARSELRRVAREAGVRRRFAPHQLCRACRRDGPRGRVVARHPTSARTYQPGITSRYLQGIGNTVIIDTVHARRAAMVPVHSSLRP